MGSRFTYANVVSTVALVIAVGGGGVAANAALANNTVGSPQIKNGQVKNVDLGRKSVTTSKLRNNSVLSRHVKNGTLQGKDVKNGSLTRNDLAPSSIVASLLASGSVTGDAIADGAVAADDLASSPLGVARAYAWNNIPAGPLGVSSVLNNGYVYNSSGEDTTVTRNGVGYYAVRFTGVDLGSGSVHVTAYGSSSDTCKVQSWGAESVWVRCFDAAGNPADNRFTVGYYR
ncbi:hypothetical protein [Nocardioides gilvus]|uniref:hypothetical protein n=1 Tax=Nocardioides gilvus TaxID=1735589 RepID=UPI000D7431E0|nr:hypothetical protein [Nocardioides gilvus]